jgi:hypothetical protein
LGKKVANGDEFSEKSYDESFLGGQIVLQNEDELSICQRWASAILVRNSAILRTSKSIAELRTKKGYGTAIADLQNLTSASPQLSAVSGQFHYFPVPFPQLRMFLKITQNIFRILCF